jgi:hypothetical protein
VSDEPKLLFCGVRDGGDFWHLECRFDDGQKFAAVQVSIEHEKLADEIAAYLNTRKEREQVQGLAEIRIRQLGEQLAACEKALAERDARVLVLTRFALNIRDGWDCDEYAHRHRTPCRCCEAEKLVGPAAS